MQTSACIGQYQLRTGGYHKVRSVKVGLSTISLNAIDNEIQDIVHLGQKRANHVVKSVDSSVNVIECLAHEQDAESGQVSDFHRRNAYEVYICGRRNCVGRVWYDQGARYAYGLMEIYIFVCIESLTK